MYYFITERNSNDYHGEQKTAVGQQREDGKVSYILAETCLNFLNITNLCDPCNWSGVSGVRRSKRVDWHGNLGVPNGARDRLQVLQTGRSLTLASRRPCQEERNRHAPQLSALPRLSGSISSTHSSETEGIQRYSWFYLSIPVIVHLLLTLSGGQTHKLFGPIPLLWGDTWITPAHCPAALSPAWRACKVLPMPLFLIFSRIFIYFCDSTIWYSELFQICAGIPSLESGKPRKVEFRQAETL